MASSAGYLVYLVIAFGGSMTRTPRLYEMGRDRLDVGQVDLLSVLQVQAQWVGVVNIRSDRLAQRVDLHLALGGSFEETPGQNRP